FLAGPLVDLTSFRHVMLSQAILIWILLLLFLIVKTRPYFSKRQVGARKKQISLNIVRHITK
ncbi:MAG: hypothetical protein ACKO16_12270, partial [Gemmataceae bacterium]